MRNEREGMLRGSPDACACTLVARCRSPAVRPLSRRRATKLLHSVAWGQRQVLQFLFVVNGGVQYDDDGVDGGGLAARGEASRSQTRR